MNIATPQEIATAFMAANDASPVVSGEIYYTGPERPDNIAGVIYILRDESRWTLPTAAARLVNDPYPKWDL